MSLFDQLSNADKDYACCNKVMAEYYDRYLKEENESMARLSESHAVRREKSLAANVRAYAVTRKKRR